MGIDGKFGRLYGLPERGQTDISSLLKVQRESLIPAALSLLVPRPFSRPDDKIPARSLTRNGLLRTQ
jgi:hypothetical protein